MASAHSEIYLKKKAYSDMRMTKMWGGLFQDLVPFISQELLFCYKYAG